MLAGNTNLFCKIYIDTDFTKEIVLKSIHQKIVGELKDAITRICSINLVKNDNFHVRKRNEIPNGFYYSRHVLEIEPIDDTIPESYIQLVAWLLEGLWDIGYRAVASCDFEELLPKRGGQASE